KRAERLIIDSRKLPSEAGLPSLARLAQALPEVDLVDLSWLGISPIRGLGAAFFDLDPTPLSELDRVRVSSGVEGTQVRALLMLGWLGSRLGWSNYKKVDAGEVRRWQATRKNGGTLSIELINDRRGAHHGVNELTLTAGSEEWSLARSQTCIDV